MPEQYSIEQFGQKIKEKYPEYQDIDNKELGQRMIEKYPEYQDRINVQPNKKTNNSSEFVSQNTSSSKSPEQSDGFLKSLVKGVARPFAEVGTSAYNVGSSISHLVKGDVQGADKALYQSRNIPFLGETKPAFNQEDVNQKGVYGYLPNLKKSAGYATEIASTIAPVGKVGTGGKALLKGATQYGLLSGAGELGNQLEQNKGINVGKIAGSTLLGAAVPVVGRVASKVIKGAGNVGAEILGKTTGTSGDVIKEAFNNPNVIKYARQAGTKGGADLQKQALEEAQLGLKNMVENKGKEYVVQLNKIKANPQEMRGVVDDLRNKMVQHLENYDIKVGEGGKLDFSNSALDHSNALQKAYNTVNTWTDHTAAGLDRLKKKLGQFADQVPSTEQRGGVSNIINDLKNSTKQHLNEKVPGYQEMTSKYAQASELHDEIKKALSLGDKASQDTAIRKLLSTTRENNDLRREFVNVLSGASGSDITGKLAASSLASLLPKGLTGKIATGVIGGVGGFLTPSAVPLLGAYFTASSPRVVAEFTSLISKATKPMIRLNKFSPKIQNGLRILLQRSLDE